MNSRFFALIWMPSAQSVHYTENWLWLHQFSLSQAKNRSKTRPKTKDFFPHTLVSQLSITVSLSFCRILNFFTFRCRPCCFYFCHCKLLYFHSLTAGAGFHMTCPVCRCAMLQSFEFWYQKQQNCADRKLKGTAHSMRTDSHSKACAIIKDKNVLFNTFREWVLRCSCCWSALSFPFR